MKRAWILGAVAAICLVSYIPFQSVSGRRDSRAHGHDGGASSGAATSKAVAATRREPLDATDGAHTVSPSSVDDKRRRLAKYFNLQHVADLSPVALKSVEQLLIEWEKRKSEQLMQLANEELDTVQRYAIEAGLVADLVKYRAAQEAFGDGAYVVVGSAFGLPGLPDGWSFIVLGNAVTVDDSYASVFIPFRETPENDVGSANAVAKAMERQDWQRVADEVNELSATERAVRLDGYRRAATQLAALSAAVARGDMTHAEYHAEATKLGNSILSPMLRIDGDKIVVR